jgi:mRNA-degrading endonuclease toxin of MazEF toxin-antitoxin module
MNHKITAEYIKDFELWTTKKIKINDRTNVFFEERQVWWCSLGVNVGAEIDGKNHNFERPILILKKYSKNTFLAVPLSSTIRNGKHYFDITTNGDQGQLLFNQAKTMDSKRLLRKISKISSKKFLEITNSFKECF